MTYLRIIVYRHVDIHDIAVDVFTYIECISEYVYVYDKWIFFCSSRLDCISYGVGGSWGG